MQYRISDKMAPLKPSAIREFFKYSAIPGVIALSAGGPAPESLPLETVQQLMQKILAETPQQALAYGQSEGYLPLRDAIKTYLANGSNSFSDNDDLIVVSGGQQAADLTCKVLLNEGDTVICEVPSFTGVLNTLRSYGANLVGVPIESDGISVDGLKIALETHKNVRMIYLIPTCQNPTGITMSAEKRKLVYALAQQYGVMIYEDSPYNELRFSGGDLPTIKSMDTDGLVIYAGTFSKILSPGIRVGYLAAPKGIFNQLVVAKQCTDVHTNMLGQMLAHRFMTECDLDAHIAGLRKLYSEKCTFMLQQMDNSFPNEVTFTRPQGGLFIWVTLPETMDGAKFCVEMAEQRKVAAVPGSAFSAVPGSCVNAFRLNYSTPSREDIVESVGRCGALLKEWLAR